MRRSTIPADETRRPPLRPCGSWKLNCRAAGRGTFRARAPPSIETAAIAPLCRRAGGSDGTARRLRVRGGLARSEFGWRLERQSECWSAPPLEYGASLKNGAHERDESTRPEAEDRKSGPIAGDGRGGGRRDGAGKWLTQFHQRELDGRRGC